LNDRANRPAARICLLGLTALLLLGAAPAGADEPATSADAARDPSEVVDALHLCLTGVMREAVTLGYGGRYQRLEPVLREVFDLDFMAEKSVGRHWKSAAPEDRVRLLDTFSRYTVANYAGRFESWSGQHFERLGEEPSARETRLVKTRLVDPERDDVMLDYRLRQTDAGWKIIDVYLNGTVSELALRRSEYSSIIKRKGLEALLVALDERIDEFASAPADQSS
jgi:phospholipid transport system substrate-binding protein